MSDTKLSFEESLKRLEEIVEHLERGDIALQDSLQLFEEGSALLAGCNQMLEEAEQKVVQLRKGSDRKPVESPFNET
ncbi:MAG: exodeoxyribonuclease VII small subunit [Oscillospiraceae bacterium]|nr:exodeoxyribonuclease VII small subunit [Oscillospiraceae bacterium]MBR0392165.1 exodeoxyribonuclease VII small subunit [Oscillospiraceae bacterium]